MLTVLDSAIFLIALNVSTDHIEGLMVFADLHISFII